MRPVRADEWKGLRDVRLRALEDAPMAFGSTLAETIVRPDSFWKDWANGERRGPAFAADDGGDLFRGLVGAYPDLRAEDVLLTSMWVDPICRRRGVARDLVAAVVSWSRERRAREVRPTVTETNRSARHLYEGCGFTLTGVTEPLPHTPTTVELEMLLVL